MMIKGLEGKILQLKPQIEEENYINRFDIRDKEFQSEGKALKLYL
jgi:hypothetical protein